MKRRVAKKVRKKGVNPRSKGKRGERLVRDALAAWTGLEFARTPSSGAFGTTNKIHELVGDVVCKNGNFAYSIEVKNVNTWNLEGFFSSPKSPVRKWWEQTLVQAEKTGKIPLLLLTKNQHPIYCLTLHEGTPPNVDKVFVLQSETEPFLYFFLLSDLTKTDPNKWIKPV